MSCDDNNSDDQSSTKQRCYVSNGSAILTNLVDLISDEETADVELVQGDRIIPAHKVLLMASSSFFKKLFLGDWKESKNKMVKLHDIPECQAVFPLFLGFLYSGHTNLTIDNVIPMLMLADKYDVPSLVDLCKRFIIGVVEAGDLEYALKWLPFADLFLLKDVKACCMSLIARNIEAAAELQCWLSLPIDLLVSTLQMDPLIVRNEFALFSVVEARLLAEDLLKVAESTRRVMEHVNFKLMTTAQLLKVEKSKIITKAGIDAIKVDLMEAFRYNAISSDNLDGDVDIIAEQGRWYLNDQALNLKSKFTDGVAPIHIATSSTGRALHHPQRWILRLKNDSHQCSHRLTAEIVASKETYFVNSSAHFRADRYKLQVKFVICNSDGVVYWTPAAALEDITIPDTVDEPLVALQLVCDNKLGMFACRCAVVPEMVYYTVKLKKL